MNYCRICNSQTSASLDLGLQPFANKYPKSPTESEVKQPMIIEYCSTCMSAQIASVIDRNLMFEDYYYLSSVNKELVKHFEQFAENELSSSKFVIDIGSNDGILLRPLSNRGIRCLGVDPSVNVGKLANEEGLETIIGFFDENVGNIITSKYGFPDAVVASSVFTHIEEPKKFIRDLRSICNSDTSVYIEIEYLKNLIDTLQFERFYFDRPHYYSVHGMKSLFEESGFSLIDVKEISPHGGSLRLKFKLKVDDSLEASSKRVGDFLQQELEGLSIHNFERFKKRVHQEAKKFHDELLILKKKGLTVIGYGCPARVATITNFSGIDSSLVSYILEDSPLKIDKFSPGMHIPIVSSERLKELDFDAIVVFAYEYFETISAKTSLYNVPHYMPVPFKLIGN